MKIRFNKYQQTYSSLRFKYKKYKEKFEYYDLFVEKFSYYQKEKEKFEKGGEGYVNDKWEKVCTTVSSILIKKGKLTLTLVEKKELGFSLRENNKNDTEQVISIAEEIIFEEYELIFNLYREKFMDIPFDVDYCNFNTKDPFIRSYLNTKYIIAISR